MAKLDHTQPSDAAASKETAWPTVGSEADGVLPLMVRLREKADKRSDKNTAATNESRLVSSFQYMGDDGG